MTVAKLIEKLKAMPQDLPVIVKYNDGSGCSTCGFGGETEMDIEGAYDLETRVELAS